MLKRYTILNHADFRLVDKKAVERLKEYKTKNIYLRGFFACLKFKSTKVYYKREKRIGGDSKYGILRLIKLAFSGLLPSGNANNVLPLYIIEERYN